MRKMVVVCTALVLFTAGHASGFDFEQFAKTEILRCVHPTVNFSMASAAMIGKTVCEDGITKAKVKVDYQGWVRHNSMVVEISLKEGSPKMLRVLVLNDSTGTGRAHPVIQSCVYTEGWQEIPD